MSIQVLKVNNSDKTTSFKNKINYIKNYQHIIKNDKVELNNTNQKPVKKSFWKSGKLIAGAIATVILGSIIGFKAHQNNKTFKKQVSALYKDLAKDITSELKEINFKLEVPKLKFRGRISKLFRFSGEELASYSSSYNRVKINKNKLNKKIYLVELYEGQISHAFGKKS